MRGSARRGPPEKTVPTLAELGIGKKESVQAQSLATIKKEDPELHEQVRVGRPWRTLRRYVLPAPGPRAAEPAEGC